MNWSTATLGEIAEIVSGSTPRTGSPEFWGGPIPWVTPADLTKLSTRTIDETPRTLTELGLASCGAKVLPVNSVLFSSRAPIGHVAITGVPMATNQGFKSFVPNRDRLEPTFLYWWLKSKKEYLQNLGVGATFKEVSKAIVSGIRIPLPPLPEQRRIASILDQADALRTKRRRTSAHLYELSDSIYSEMFDRETWDVLPLGQVIERIDSGRSPVCLDRAGETDEWAVLKLSAVTSGRYVGGENKAISEGFTPRPSDEVHAGDILLTRKNTPDLVGASAFVYSTAKKRLLPDLIFRLVPSAVADPLFLQCQLARPAGRRALRRLASGSASSMSNISKGRLGTLAIELPPISIQRTFAEMLREAHDLENASVTHLAKLDELFASLQSRAFKGEL